MRLGARARAQSSLCLRGIPRDATVEEVRKFLDGVIPAERIKFSKFSDTGVFSGWATVTCLDAKEEAAVRAKHTANIRHRYIEVLEDRSQHRRPGFK
ncbi:hypothetical protein KFE25_005879 [Diacronema lutheri]|uniref:RRM domain-containing protein n=2 Tax=Diacronema lutheri TaxID=2081491 RepID=A0A8J5XS03_DIALT|nr:hypothetical protein KFE25_005879 [Diacronema lutheri]